MALVLRDPVFPQVQWLLPGLPMAGWSWVLAMAGAQGEYGEGRKNS